MSAQPAKPSQLVGFIATSLELIGMLVAVGAAALIYSSQAQIQGDRMWPNPGLTLLDWALVGVLGFACAYYAFKTGSLKWAKNAWLVVGMCLPLVVIGAFSIGPFVLISMVLFATAAVLISIRFGLKFMDGLIFSVLGMVVNLALLSLFIVVSA